MILPPIVSVNCQYLLGNRWSLKTPTSSCLVCARILAELILCMSCAHNYSCCEFMNTVVMLCPGDSISQHSSPSPGSCVISAPSSWCSLDTGMHVGIRGMIKMSHLGMRTHNDLFVVLWPALSLNWLLSPAKRRFFDQGWTYSRSMGINMTI